jgi:hypothetical protein
VAGNDRVVAEDRVRERDLGSAGAVNEFDLDARRLVVGLEVGRRQAGDRRLARIDPMADVPEMDHVRAVRLLDRQGGHPVVTAAGGRVFEGDRVVQPVHEARKAGPPQMAVRPTLGQRRTEVELPD